MRAPSATRTGSGNSLLTGERGNGDLSSTMWLSGLNEMAHKNANSKSMVSFVVSSLRCIFEQGAQDARSTTNRHHKFIWYLDVQLAFRRRKKKESNA